MNKENLLLMAKLLTEVRDGTWKISSEPEQIKEKDNKTNVFDLANWVSIPSRYSNSPCGFTACAVGHAILDKRFNDLGFGFDPDDNGLSLAPYFKRKDGGRSYGGWFGVEVFFGINEKSTKLLFSDYCYASHLTNSKNPKNLLNQIIRRIQLLVNIGEQEFNKKLADPSNVRITPDLKIRKFA